MQTLEQIHDHQPNHQSLDHVTPYPNEIRRWLLIAGLPMLAACICIALSFRIRWFYGGVIGFGPVLGILAIIYLAISSDTNGTVTATVAAEPATTLHEEAPASAAA